MVSLSRLFEGSGKVFILDFGFWGEKVFCKGVVGLCFFVVVWFFLFVFLFEL